jgi:uncharacterized protein
MPRKLWIVVKPHARQEKIEIISENEYAVWIRAPAHEGRANEAVIELLARHFSLPKSSVRIVLGKKSKKKLVQIS